MMMEGEIKNFLLVWSIVLPSLYYCHSIGRHFTTTTTTGSGSGSSSSSRRIRMILRPMAIIPISCLFFLLPLKLTTVYLGATTTFFIAWLANFKLLLFAYGHGPLVSSPPLSISTFLAIASLPIKFKHPLPPPPNVVAAAAVVVKPHEKIGHKPRRIMNYLSKHVALFVCVHLCRIRPAATATADLEKHFSIPMIWSMLLYCVMIYLALELLLAVSAGMIETFMDVELEPQFNEPYMATSMQDFWGRRWNLMVSNILRPTVYLPVRSFFIGVGVGKEYAAIPAVLATFLTSGLMHEYILYIIGRQKPTGEMTCFFVVNGILLAIELVMKRAVKGQFWLPKIVSIPLTLSIVLVTSFWLFFPPVFKSKGDIKGCKETLAILESLKNGRLISPPTDY